MAYPFGPVTTADLKKISKQIEKLTLALKKSKQHIVFTYPKEKIRIQNKTTVFK
jgi:hypothetical protein